uniref:Uncharacterized protein n=1 Tax=Physcomitrium patens TaxID=3218 RepID=A0A2K1ISI5_PHYPA|nr:hypothetical protein PHYPA_026358 [Physcomitrium patens]
MIYGHACTAQSLFLYLYQEPSFLITRCPRNRVKSLIRHQQVYTELSGKQCARIRQGWRGLIIALHSKTQYREVRRVMRRSCG